MIIFMGIMLILFAPKSDNMKVNMDHLNDRQNISKSNRSHEIYNIVSDTIYSDAIFPIYSENNPYQNANYGTIQHYFDENSHYHGSYSSAIQLSQNNFVNTDHDNTMIPEVSVNPIMNRNHENIAFPEFSGSSLINTNQNIIPYSGYSENINENSCNNNSLNSSYSANIVGDTNQVNNNNNLFSDEYYVNQNTKNDGISFPLYSENTMANIRHEDIPLGNISHDGIPTENIIHDNIPLGNTSHDGVSMGNISYDHISIGNTSHESISLPVYSENIVERSSENMHSFNDGCSEWNLLKTREEIQSPQPNNDDEQFADDLIDWERIDMEMNVNIGSNKESNQLRDPDPNLNQKNSDIQLKNPEKSNQNGQLEEKVTNQKNAAVKKVVDCQANLNKNNGKRIEGLDTNLIVPEKFRKRKERVIIIEEEEKEKEEKRKIVKKGEKRVERINPKGKHKEEKGKEILEENERIEISGKGKEIVSVAQEKDKRAMERIVQENERMKKIIWGKEKRPKKKELDREQANIMRSLHNVCHRRKENHVEMVKKLLKTVYMGIEMTTYPIPIIGPYIEQTKSLPNCLFCPMAMAHYALSVLDMPAEFYRKFGIFIKESKAKHKSDEGELECLDTVMDTVYRLYEASEGSEQKQIEDSEVHQKLGNLRFYALFYEAMNQIMWPSIGPNLVPQDAQLSELWEKTREVVRMYGTTFQNQLEKCQSVGIEVTKALLEDVKNGKKLLHK